VETRRRRRIDTVVVGGGQGGLAVGYFLARQGRDFVILDAARRTGDAWRNRWDSLRLFTPARRSALPGLRFPAPGGYFPTKNEIAEYLESYALHFQLPVRLDTRVDSLTRCHEGYALNAAGERFVASRVVVATGPFQQPSIPGLARQLDPTLIQLHSSEYRNPRQLPDGDVLVVGAGNSGAEIAVELAADGRRVWLSGRDTGRVPLRLFRARLFWWLTSAALNTDTAVGRKLRARSAGKGSPLIRLSRRDILRAGVQRVPRTQGVTDGKPRLLDGRVLTPSAVVWATGFRPDFTWIHLPIFGPDGYPVHYRGVVTRAPGVYFAGLPFQYTLTSAAVGGVGADARYIVEHMRGAPEARDAVLPPPASSLRVAGAQ
jgi:putative flavoprotein involved in K+ transport